MLGSKRNTAWTPKDGEQLPRMLDEGRSPVHIARALKQLRHAVVDRLQFLQKSLRRQSATRRSANARLGRMHRVAAASKPRQARYAGGIELPKDAETGLEGKSASARS